MWYASAFLIFGVFGGLERVYVLISSLAVRASRRGRGGGLPPVGPWAGSSLAYYVGHRIPRLPIFKK
jgi:hypothetical protein